MGRLTETDEKGNWSIKGLPWGCLREGQVITEETRQILYGCLCKLKDYEDSGLTPEQIYDMDNSFSHMCNIVNNKWIPCSKQLPEMHKVPLEYDEYYMVSDSVLVTDGNDVFILEYEVDDDCCYGWFFEGTKCENEITHWMPMPKPCREEE